MFEIIGIGVVAFFGWIILKVLLCRIFPKYGFRVAEKQYEKDPSDENEQLLWQARSRVPRNKRDW